MAWLRPRGSTPEMGCHDLYRDCLRKALFLGFHYGEQQSIRALGGAVYVFRSGRTGDVYGKAAVKYWWTRPLASGYLKRQQGYLNDLAKMLAGC